MIALSPPGTTRRIGKSQGYLGLSISDRQMQDGTPIMLTMWEPTPAELALLNQGRPVNLWILGTAHPPVMVDVGEVE